MTMQTLNPFLLRRPTAFPAPANNSSSFALLTYPSLHLFNTPSLSRYAIFPDHSVVPGRLDSLKGSSREDRCL